jgi:LAS superfamily LD-carboxypeptidase LdcB
MNILVNVDFIASTIIGLKDDKQNVFLGEFLTTLMSGISSAIGGINEFVVGFDETTSTIIIYDAQYSNAADQQKPLPEIPVFGLKTTVRSYGLQTEASSKLGSMLAISARAGAHSLAGSNQDASSFVAINSKLKDRLLIDTSNDPTENTDTGSVTAPTTDFSIQNQFNAQVCNYYGVDSKPVSYDTSLIYGVQNYYINQLISIKGGSSPNEADSVTATGILPLALNITLEGIGGIPLYQGFTLPKDRLPAQYKDGGNGKQLVGFVVSGLNHTISNNEWLTTIISKMVNLPKGRRTVELSRSKSINTTPPPTRQTPRGSRVGQDPYDTSPVARYYKGKGYSNGEIPNDELVYLNTDDAESNRLHRLHPVAAAQWSALLTAARKDGFGKKDLNISYLKNAAYRSRADQKVAANAATPGQSPHGWGGVVDIQQLFTAQDKGSAKPGPAARVRATNKLYKWLESNGPLYGWYNPYRLADGQGQEESWHFEYWGSI